MSVPQYAKHARPEGPPPRGLVRKQAAAYLGLSATKFIALVRAGRLPRPLNWGVPQIWDRRALDRAVDEESNLVDDVVHPSGEDEAIRRIHERSNAIRHEATQ